MFENKVFSEEKITRKSDTGKFLPRVLPIYFNNPNNFQNYNSKKLKNGGQNTLRNISQIQQKNKDWDLKYKNMISKDRQKTHNSLFSSIDEFSQPALSSLMDISNCHVMESQSTDLKKKLKIFVLKKLPLIAKSLQPTKIYKLFLILSRIVLANIIPKTRVKLSVREKKIISEMIYTGLNKKINPK